MGVAMNNRFRLFVIPFLVASLSAVFLIQALALSDQGGGKEPRMRAMANVITTTTPTFTPTVTPTICPIPTPVALLVDPVLSPTNQFTQTIVIYMSGADAFTVTLETGVFTTTDTSYPTMLSVDLDSNTEHHLNVRGHFPGSGGTPGCPIFGYTLSTSVDRFGDPLTIVQVSSLQHFPIVNRTD